MSALPDCRQMLYAAYRDRVEYAVSKWSKHPVDRLRRLRGENALNDVIADTVGRLFENQEFSEAEPDSFEHWDAILHELDNARQAFKRKSESVSKSDDAADSGDIDQFTEAGRLLTDEPSRALEREASESAEAQRFAERTQQLVDRGRIEYNEDVAFGRAVAGWADTARKLEVARLLNQGLSDREINACCGADRGVVSRLRKELEALAEQHLTIGAEHGVSTPLFDAIERGAGLTPETAPQPDAPMEELFWGGGAGADEGVRNASQIDQQWTAPQHAPEVAGDDLSEHVVNGYQRTRSGARAMADWSWRPEKKRSKPPAPAIVLQADLEAKAARLKARQAGSRAALLKAAARCGLSERDLREIATMCDTAGMHFGKTLTAMHPQLGAFGELLSGALAAGRVS